MASLVRASKFKHVYCDAPRPDATFTNLRLSTVTGEQNYIKANTKYIAVGLQGGGGPIGILPLDKPGRVRIDLPVIAGHAGPVIDFDFSPFEDNIIASSSEDCTIKLWDIPEGGPTTNISIPVADLTGHGRKVNSVKFHPTASNVIASTSADQTVKVWDIEKSSVITNFDECKDLILDLAWDYNGNQYAITSKDRNVRMVDARTAALAGMIEGAHEGSKSVKTTYLGHLNKLLTVGFSKTSTRQIKIWDPRKVSEEVFRLDIDNAAGVIMPFFDPDTSLLYLAGKGDGNVRVYEISSEGDHAFACTDFRTNISAKGMAMVPKRGLNIMHNETARLIKLTTSTVDPLSFIVPRKSEGFQDDLFPDSFSGEPSHTVDEWYAGSDQPPKLMSLNPASNSQKIERAPSLNKTKSYRTPAELAADLDAAKARIKYLEDKLTENNIEFDK